MTSAVISPPAERPPATTIGFSNLLLSEWTKLRSVRSTYWTTILAAFLTVGLGAVVCIRWAQLITNADPGKIDGFDPTLTSLSGVYLAQIAIGTLGVLVISSEYGTGMIRATFAAVPQRRAVLAAKAIVFGACTLVIGQVMSFAAFGIGQAILSTAHPHVSGIQASASLSQPEVLRAVCGAALYLTVVGLLGFGLGAAIRHTAGALPAFFGVLFGLSAIVDLLPTSWRNDIMPYLPANAGSQAFTIEQSHDALPPWAGLGVLCLYAAAAIAIGLLLVDRRDA